MSHEALVMYAQLKAMYANALHENETLRAELAEARRLLDEARAPGLRGALLWLLWHHQGGTSPVGQPLRRLLGIGKHDRLTDDQLADAKSFAATVPAQPAVSTTKRTNRELHEEAAGMNLSEAFFAHAGIDPDGYPPADAALADRVTPSLIIHYGQVQQENEKLREEIAALRARQPAQQPEHVAWLRYNDHGGRKPTTLHLCDSDAPGAFKVYREAPERQPAQALTVQDVSSALSVLSNAMKADPDFAWTWHCNIAMTAQDAGAPHDRANKWAAEFMKRAFDVDTLTQVNALLAASKGGAT